MDKFMTFIKRTITLFLCLLLTGQSIAFAAGAQQKTLAQYQQRAKQEIQHSDWLKKDGLYLLGITGTAAGLIIFYQRKLAFLENKKLNLENQVRTQQRVITELEKHFQKNYNRLRKAEHARDVLRENIKNINAEAKLLQKQQEVYLAMLNLPVTANIEKYLVLFEGKISNQTRQQLMSELAKEPWVQALSKTERTEFTNLIHTIAMQNGQGTTAGTMTQTWMLVGRAATRANKGYAPLLKNFARHLMKPRNLLTVSIVLVLGWAAPANAQAQKRAARIDANFNLFLNATPQQLADMQKDPIQRQVCIQGAEALHLLSTMDQEEVHSMVQELQPKRSVVRKRNNAR